MKGFYQHYKGPIYEVLGAVVHSETLEELTLYRSLKGSPEYAPETLWVRPKAMFLSTIEIDGSMKQRFRKLDATEVSALLSGQAAQTKS